MIQWYAVEGCECDACEHAPPPPKEWKCTCTKPAIVDQCPTCAGQPDPVRAAIVRTRRGMR